MFANCSMAGMQMGIPDVCLSPPPPPFGPIPIPYPNMAQLPMGVGFSVKHLISMMPAHNLMTMVPMSLGDSTGCLPGGVMSGMMMGPGRNIMGSFKVLSGGAPITKLLSPAMQNLTNVPMGMNLVPSQVKMLVMT